MELTNYVADLEEDLLVTVFTGVLSASKHRNKWTREGGKSWKRF